MEKQERTSMKFILIRPGVTGFLKPAVLSWLHFASGMELERQICRDRGF